MSWIALVLLLSDLTGATALSSPSNSAARESDTSAASDPTPTEPLPQEALRDEFAARRFTIEARLGIGAPTGVLGGALSYSPIPAIGVDCGAGSNTHSLQLACGLRARLVLGGRSTGVLGGLQRALTLTSGFSAGPYVDDHALGTIIWVDGPGPAKRNYQRAYWWNTDLGVEGRYESLVLRMFAGAAVLLNPGAGTDLVTGDERIERPTTSLFYFGFGVGLAP